MKDKGTKSLENHEYEEQRRNDLPPRRLKSVDIADYKLFEEEQQRTTQLVFSYKGGKKVPKLKEPRNLYAFSTGSGHQPPKWPVELRVLNIRPRFIEYVPKNPEPFWKSDVNSPGLLLRKLPDESGKVVYDNPQGAEKYFMRSKAAGNVSEKPFYKLGSTEDRTLLFESRFESGNLKRAIQIGPYEYQLWMKTDQYTIKHTQWFYFRVKNTQAGITYRFTIMNFIKSGSLYNDGMRPLVYSEMNAYKNKIGWLRTGENVKYYKNDIRRDDTTKDRYHYSLTWTCQFPYSSDTCYFAHCYPYTYSDLQEYLQGIRNDAVKSRICKQRVLCRTLAGNFVYILTVTNPSRRPCDAEAKRAVVVTARVHPGETNSSWMMKGLLDFLTSNSPDSKLLRDTFIFKIVPMINPDGVIIGNYRCSLAGRDLNRNYRTMLKDSFPPIWHIRNMTKKLLEERDITVYCDLHGHSRKQNVFMYGCDNRNDPLKRLQERVFPTMMSKNAPCKFSYKGCKFKVQKSKEGTGRVVMWQMGITNSLTMEATFCGSSLGKRNGFHFNTVDLEAMGYHFCDTLLDFCDPDDSKYIAILRELEQKLREEILAKMQKKGTAPPNMSLSDVDLDANYTSDIESSTGGSDSSVSDGLPMHLIYAPKVLHYNQHSRKKKLRTRKERNKRRAKAMKIKDVLLTDVPKPEPETPVKLSYKQGKRPTINSAARARLENPRPRKHEHHDCRPFTPVHLCKEHADRGPDYLEAVTNAYMLNGVLVNESSAGDVPHLRYTAGSNYLNEISPHEKRDSISRWSTHSSVLAQAIEQSSEEGNFTVGYLARQLEKNGGEKNSDLRGHETHSMSRMSSSALDLARKMSMYNSRYKMEAASQHHMDNQAPVLKPKSPPSSPPNYSWRPRGTCLSSTKAQLHHQPKGQLSDLRKSMSQISLIDNKAVNATKNALASASGSWMDLSDYAPSKAKISRQSRQEKAVLHRGRPAPSSDLVEPPKQAQNWEVQTAKVEGMFDLESTKRAMMKYTSNGNTPHQAMADMAITGSTKAARSNPPMKSIASISAAFARNSPVYVTLPVDRPPVKVKPPHRMPGDDGTPLDLRSSVGESADEPGKLVSYVLKRQREESGQHGKMHESSSGSESDGAAGPFVSQFSRIKETSPRREMSMSNHVISPDYAENGHLHRVSNNRYVVPKKTSPIAAGVVQIGAAMDEQFCLTGDMKKPRRRHKPSKKAPQSPTRSVDAAAAPSTISLTFKTDELQAHDLNPQPPPRLGAFAPQFKHFSYKPTHR